MKKTFKKLMALVTVLVMVVSLVSVPNASANAAEGSGSYDTANTWWGGGSYLIGYAAESGTIFDMETSKGYWPEGGFPWFSAIVLDENADGNYVVTEVVPDDGSNDKGAIELKAGRVVVVYHDGNANADSVAFYDSLVAGDVLKATGLWGDYVPTWASLAEGADVATFTKVEAEEEQGCAHEGLVHMDAVDAGCHFDGNIEYWVCYDCETVWQDAALTQITNIKNVVVPATGSENVVHFEAVEPACHFEGCIEYWYCPDCEKVWQDEALTQLTNHKNVVVPALGGEVVHVEAVAPTATENGNIEHWYCEECGTVWQDATLTQITNHMNVIVPATGEVEEPAEVLGTATYANGYDWSNGVGHIYAYASANAADTISVITGQDAATYAWWWTVILEADADGNFVVTSADFASNNGAITAELGEGKIIMMAHDSTPLTENFAWLQSLAVGDVLGLEMDWADLAAASYVEMEINFVTPGSAEEPVDPEQPCTHEGLVHMDAVEAGCHFDGNIEYWVCYDCETVWQDEALTQLTNIKNVVVPATGSENVVHFEAVEPACHFEGCIEYWYCPDCEKVWQDEALTQLTNHKNVVVPALGGEVVHVEAVAPTATKNGNIEHWYCEKCEQVWQNEALTQLTNHKNVILPATGEVEAPETEAPKTGDSMPVALMVTFLLASAAIVVVGYKKRNA